MPETAPSAIRIRTRRRARFATGALIAAAVIAAAPAVSARPQDSEPPDPVDLARLEPATRPEVVMIRTDAPPEIDGRLDDPAWDAAAVLDDFTQVTPVEGAAPSERTEVRLLYDRDFLYVGVRAFDAEPSKIIAKQMLRDGDQDSDDHILFGVDPFLDRRNGFFFQVNPNGARLDGLIEDNRNIREDWDGIWYAKSRVDDTGWTAEIAIPFKTINFDPNAPAWGFNFERFIRRRNEIVRWTAASPNKSLRTVADFGNLEGIEEIDQGLGLDFKPFIVGTYQLENNEGRDEEFELEPGFDLFWKITPSLTAALTVNTDFAETEVDERRVNLTRFPLFFPEKRDFFLQDAYVFNFGGIRRTPLPFFSRRIGIGPGGQEVPIDVGVKLTGNADRWNIGVLSVMTEAAAGVEEKNLSVGRVAYQIGDESTVGAIFTSGDPRTNGDNNLVGLDLNLRDSNFDGSNALEGHAWLQSTDSSDADGGREFAWGGSILYPNDRVNWDLFFAQIDEGYNPALGFVSRRGIREYGGSYRYRWRPEDSWMRRFDLGSRFFLVTTLDNEIETLSITAPGVEFENNAGDEFEIDPEFNREQLFEPFEIADGVIIPVGVYDFARLETSMRTSSGRPFGVGVGVEFGDFFTGSRTDYEAELEWRASEHFFASAGYEMNDIDLPQGDFITRIIRGRVNVMFTPDLSWNTIAQYDNVSESFGVNSRVRWEIEPGNELFVVVNSGFDVDNGSFRATTSEITTKLGWTFRF
ncbi:MAG: DUF5916 domain-containing protein [Phycisphaerales bacterium]